MRPVYSSLRSSLRIPAPNSTTNLRHFSARPSLSLWNGTTQPYENLKVAAPPPNAPQAVSPAISSILSDAENIENVHKKFVEDILNRAAASAHGLDPQIRNTASSSVPKERRQRTRQHSLSEPPLFRTDGPLTPYPIELDSGELLEPKHATLVRITDRSGEERRIVVAEVEDESGKQRRVLLAVDLNEYQLSGGSGGAVGRRITADEMYATLNTDAQKS